MLDTFILEPRTAYFSMEIALINEIPTFSGTTGGFLGCIIMPTIGAVILLYVISIFKKA